MLSDDAPWWSYDVVKCSLAQVVWNMNSMVTSSYKGEAPREKET